MRRVNANDPSAPALFWNAVQDGQVVVYPTDTLYGLGTDAYNFIAVEKIARIKNRIGPFSVMLGQLDDLNEYALVSSEIAHKLAAVLPGPFTMILPSRQPESLSSLVLGRGNKVGFRVPVCPFIQRTFQLNKGLVVSTSVNRTGESPLQDPDRIQEQFREDIDLLLDAGSLPPSQGSTVVDASVQPWQIVRPGDGRL